MKKQPEKKSFHVLLVEGKDDLHVLSHLLEHYKIPEVFTIKDKEGFENMRDTLDVELDRSGLCHLGIIVDADEDINDRWASLRDRLRKLGYEQCPDTPAPDGTIVEQRGKPTVGVWIMPDNTHPGMLEHFIEFLVPDDDVLWKRADNCLQQLPETERLYSPVHRMKALVHTWLAWQKEPGKPMGQAITARYLNAEAPHAHTLVAWLSRLFELDVSESCNK